MKSTIRPALVSPALIVALLAACEELPTGPVLEYDAPVKGIHFVDWTADGYGTPLAATRMAALAATGASHVVIIITAYQGSLAEPDVFESAQTPIPSAVSEAIATARGLGLSVVIKPHVDLLDGSWRGRIDPTSPAEWFEDYGNFVMRWADIAQQQGAREFVVGTELASTLEHEDRWRDLIARVRAVFNGELLYAASWDEAQRVPFWDAVDRVGVDFYYPVARRANPGRLEILAEWQPWLSRLERLHHQTGKQIVLTEIGYRSVDGAGMRPYAFGDAADVDLVEQADLYWAALTATSDLDWLDGIHLWNWLANGTGPALARDFTPRGKPALVELTSAWGGELP